MIFRIFFLNYYSYFPGGCWSSLISVSTATDDSSVKQPLVGAGREQPAALCNLYFFSTHKTSAGKSK